MLFKVQILTENYTRPINTKMHTYWLIGLNQLVHTVSIVLHEIGQDVTMYNE
jgi:hypothetical protein